MSSSNNQNQPSVTCPPTSTGPFVAPPPPGYPTMDNSANQNQAPVETKSRGDGFWKGCCAALCCCCVLDACF
ncbi:cysteine-rich and transmembrane domain-containing protein WIH1-like [Pistacia vera]|uniref:Uncharacterized protein n=3 Tax=Pistacia TaxID=55512 RepID=A0ACC1ANK9_9ROSI|nr:cysteine-rich and transmembrane domain-containing protein WIH1-like [Pistacia vera]KAJ0028453.1 hypothetical protein Pint_36603 [Pistacia integerrima]KAJ0087920.1 hypothetical protein Patl1_33293 [Pistacia atlantica]KAJ0088279.1 hypothetical protein Patl1_33235 [Pistacia atlantica]